MANNDLIYNAALAGAAGGAKSARWITDTVGSSYLPDRNAAIAFATVLDNAIPTDPDMNTSKAELILILCSAVFQSKAFTAGQVTTDQALAVAALYNELSAVMLPISGGGGSPLSATFWVDPGVADTGNGSATSPFKTVAEAIVAAEAVTLDVPRTILLAAGDYAGETIAWDSVGDTANKNRVSFVAFAGTAQNIGAVTVVGNTAAQPDVTFSGVGNASLKIPSITVIGAEAATLYVIQSYVFGGIVGNSLTTLHVLDSEIGDGFGDPISGGLDVIGQQSSIFGIDGANSVTLRDCTGEYVFNAVTVTMANCTMGGLTEGTHDLDNCQISSISSFSGGASTYRDCTFTDNVGTLNVHGGATFINCVINNPLVDSNLSALRFENCLFTLLAGTAITGNSITVQKTRLTGPLTDTGTLAIDRSSYDAAIKDAVGITSSGLAITDVLQGVHSIAYTMAAPLVLTLVPAGHPPGLYAVGCDCILRTAATAGTLARIFSYSAPTFGPTNCQSFAVPATSALGRMVPSGTNTAFYALQYVRSDGTADITATFTPAGITGSPVVDIYANATLVTTA